MDRRSVLKWISRGLGTMTAGVIGLPGVSYMRGALQPSQASAATFSRLARLKDLPVGRPLQVPVIGQLRDAWSVEANQVIGRVWLMRTESGDSTDSGGDPSNVRAFTSVCPHMGCHVQLQGNGENFICPCHRAKFELDGARVTDAHSGEGSHAPRGLDSLDCRIVQDEASGEAWVEVMYQKFETGRTEKVPS